MLVVVCAEMTLVWCFFLLLLDRDKRLFVFSFLRIRTTGWTYKRQAVGWRVWQRLSWWWMTDYLARPFFSSTPVYVLLLSLGGTVKWEGKIDYFREHWTADLV